MSEISQSLLRVEGRKAGNGPVITRLRRTVEAMLNYEETGTVVGTYHEWEMAFSWGRACILPAEVDEVWRCSVSPVFVHYPITLAVSAGILEVKVVNIVVEPELFEVIEVDVRKCVCIHGD
jgi:hypothetical protein